MPARSRTYATPDAQAAISEIAEIAPGPFDFVTWDDFRLYMPVAALAQGRDFFGTVEIQDAGTNRVLARMQTPGFSVRD
jgi:hypothetical protein